MHTFCYAFFHVLAKFSQSKKPAGLNRLPQPLKLIRKSNEITMIIILNLTKRSFKHIA